jgi:hypothetical protein
MAKPIDFEPYDVKSDYCTTARIRVSDKGTGIALQYDVHGGAVFTDPAKLRELASAVNRAADALEKSQSLTFGDLKPGEYFRFVSPQASKGAYIKIDENEFAGQGVPPTYFSHTHGGNPLHWKGVSVIRLRATFEPVTEEPTK